jgi:DNA invertase Pin-like site-specific DNA recombinase
MARPYRLSADDVLAVRRLVADGEPPDAVARRFGVTAWTVRAIVRRSRRADVPEEPGVDRDAAIAAYREAGAARRKASARPGTAKLDPGKVREIRRLLADGVPGVEVARRFGISKAAVSKIRNGRAWRGVE